MLSAASLIQAESGLIELAMKGGYNPQLSLKIKPEKPWETDVDFITSFKALYQDRLNIAALLADCDIFWYRKSLKYALFMMGHAWKHFNLDLTLENISQVKSNPRADYSGRHLAFASLADMYLLSISLENANLTCADLSDARLWNVNLAGANLSGAYLLKTTLGGTDLTRANLWRAITHGSMMSPEQRRFCVSQGAFIDY